MTDGQEDRLGTPEGAAPRRGSARPPSNVRTSFDEHALDDRKLDKRDTDADREDAEDERLALFLDSQHQTVLPSLPGQEGWHLCWLSTTNSRDTIHWRRSIGYELVRLSDQPDWVGVQNAGGNYADYVCVAEMVAARIPLSLYNKLMRAVHHKLPLGEEEKLRGQTDLMRESAERRGMRVLEGDGTAGIVQKAKPMEMLRE